MDRPSKTFLFYDRQGMVRSIHSPMRANRVNHFYPLTYKKTMVKLLQKNSVSHNYDERIVETSSSVWTQENNEWIYFMPTTESSTVLCRDRASIDVVLTGIGKLRIAAGFCRVQ
jgi:hypothetical protein